MSISVALRRAAAATTDQSLPRRRSRKSTHFERMAVGVVRVGRDVRRGNDLGLAPENGREGSGQKGDTPNIQHIFRIARLRLVCSLLKCPPMSSFVVGQRFSARQSRSSVSARSSASRIDGSSSVFPRATRRDNMLHKLVDARQVLRLTDRSWQDELLPTLIGAARELAEKERPRRIEASLLEMQDVMGKELRRLKALAEVNHHVRPTKSTASRQRRGI